MVQFFSEVIRYYELFKIKWFLTIKNFVGEEEDYKSYSRYYREPM